MKKIKYIILSIFSIATLFSCSDTEDIRNDIDDLNARLDKIEAMLPQINQDIENYQGILNGNILVLGHRLDENTGDYTLDLSNGTTITVYSNKVVDEDIPKMTIGEDNYWYYTINGETKLLPGEDGNPVSADPVNGKTPQIKVDNNGEWIYKYGDGDWIDGIGIADPAKGSGVKSIFDEVIVSPDGNSLTFKWTTDQNKLEKTVPIFGGLNMDIQYSGTPTFGLGQVQKFNITQEGVTDIIIETMNWGIKIDEKEMTVTAPNVNTLKEAYEDKLVIKIFSKEGFCRLVTMPVKLLTTKIDEGSATAWQNFLSGNENILLDYSYAGYMHGEGTPPDVNSLSGYTTVNIKEYKETKGIESYRLALNKILYDKKLVRTCPGETGNNNYSNANANLIVYFPEGEYVLQDGTETDIFPQIIGGNFVIKGAGAGLTRIKMTGLNDKLNKPLLNISHTNSPTNVTNSPLLATVSANAKKGDFTVKVNSTAGITAGKWVQLRLRSGNSELIASELEGITPGTWSINTQPQEATSGNEDTNGVRIFEFHQVKSVGSGTVTFEEPIMHDINIAYNDCGGWQIREYRYYENVGVEDLTFEGNCITPYYHHGPNGDNSGADDWQYDEGYRPLQFGRLVNSWVRNVNFVSVSEAVTFEESANCSAYNIQITGNRGHSAVRAQGSSRVFIGKVIDESSDTRGHGQWHGCGVSKPSIGTVIWNSTWGKDACFESHASQPRATLFDNCSGGLVKYHAGGAETENPNHLADLTIWNLYVTGTTDEKNVNFASNFNWWSNSDPWWKIYPPILVGVHGTNITWDKGTDDAKQYTYEESTGTKVTPESLYEAQLRKRLGYVPAWLNALK